MPRLTTALPLWVNRYSGLAVIRPRMRKWLIPYDRYFAGVSVTPPSTSAARSGFRAMDASSREVDRVAFGKRRAQGRSGNPSPQATCLGGCSETARCSNAMSAINSSPTRGHPVVTRRVGLAVGVASRPGRPEYDAPDASRRPLRRTIGFNWAAAMRCRRGLRVRGHLTVAPTMLALRGRD